MIRILILSSDHACGELLAAGLVGAQEATYAVTTVTRLAEAQAALLGAVPPFDVVLIDQSLELGWDGIAALADLRCISPALVAIVLTDRDDPGAGLRAYEAGAYGYLPKPARIDELSWLVQLLDERRDTAYERDWLKTLTEVAEETQRALSVGDIAELIVRGGQRLGFERARLWLLSEDGQVLVGVRQAGNYGLESFEGFVMPLRESVYAQQVVREHEPQFFVRRDRGPSYLDRHFEVCGFHPPVGEWVEMALWAGQQCLGMLALDNASQARALRPEQRALLGLFGRQVAAALERERAGYERDWLKVLTEVAEQVQRAYSEREVADIVVRGGQRLGFERARLWQLSDDGLSLVGLSQAGNQGLDDFVGFQCQVSDSPYMSKVLAGSSPAFFQGEEQGESYLHSRFAERGYHPPSGEWVGVPLWAGERRLGILVLDNTSRPRLLYPAQRALLDLFGRQVAAALERERASYERDWLKILTEVGEEMQRACSEQEVADIAVQGGRRLGFERARLWLLGEDRQTVVGVSQAGNRGLERFAGFSMPLAESFYGQYMQSEGEPRFFQGRQKDIASLDRHFAAHGFEPPVGEWVEIPLCAGDRRWGTLTLDNASQARALRPEQNALLGLFGRQVTAALERARASYERDWLKVLTEVAEKVQRARSVLEVANIVVRAGQRLGFERARLWQLSDDRLSLVGLSQVGNRGLDAFPNFTMPLAKSRYLGPTLTNRDPSFFEGRDKAPGYLDQHFEDQGFEPPVGEWVEMPLWTGDRRWGTLTLDNARQSRALRPEQRALLGLFGRQVAAALERARQSQELEILNQIGQQATARAALDNLDDLDALLEVVHQQISTLIDAHNFTVVLLDESERWLDFRLDILNGQVKPRYRRPRNRGLVGDVIAKNKPLLLPEGGEKYREAAGIRLFGPPSRSWLGVPLRIGDRAIGALAVQNFERVRAYSEADLALLTAVADQVAGAIQMARLHEQQKRSKSQLQVVHRASEEIMKLADDRNDWLWHITLTVATAEYALRFNRAVLFLAEEGGTRLRGRMGIGNFTRLNAARDWRKDVRARLDFDGYLEQLHAGQITSTPVGDFVRGWTIDLRHDRGICSLVLRVGQRRQVPAEQAHALLPPQFIEHFGPNEYAVLPLRAGSKVIGLVIVDNSHDGKALSATTLDSLETLLSQAALIRENRRQHQASNRLIELNYTVLANIGSRSLRETLTQTCQAAQALTGADCVLIYPLKPGRTPHEYDLDNLGVVGLKEARPPRNKLNGKGITAQILQMGRLTVPDVAHDRDHYNQCLVEHPFLRREGIRAFIGAAVRDPQTGEPSGVLYLNYRATQTFTEHDLRQAESFAGLAAVAILNARASEVVREGLNARDTELKILSSVLKESLERDTDEKKFIPVLLNAARGLLGRQEVRVGLLLRQWRRGAGPEAPHEVRRQYFQNPNGRVSSSETGAIYRGISGLAMESGRSQRVDDVRRSDWAAIFFEGEDYPYATASELDVPLMHDNQVIGVFNIESPEIGAFTEATQATIERLSAVAVLALDNVRRQKHLRDVLNAASAVTASTDLRKTLGAILKAVRDAAPDVSALTIWYQEPESHRICMGPHFGLHYPARIEPKERGARSAVHTVMRARQPIWEPQACDNPALCGRFVTEEAIVSVAAFPLRANGRVVGAMFFNYRAPHIFTREEQDLFPLFSAIAAASIRDAALLEVRKKQRQRLETALEINNAVGTTLELNETLRQVMTTLRGQRRQAGLSVLILIYNKDEQMLEFTPASRAFYQIDDPDSRGLTHVGLDERGIACLLARRSLASKQQEWLNLPLANQHPEYRRLICSTQSELCLTLMSGERLMGVLILESSQPNAFREEDVELMRILGQQVSIAIDRAYQSAQLRFKTAVVTATAWTAAMAHDIKSEVGTIRDRAYWISEDPHISEEAKDYAREIDASAERLVGTLRDVSPTHQQEPELTPIDDWLPQVVASMIAKRGADVQVEYDLDCCGLEIEVARGALWQVLRFLVHNALEAMRNEGQLKLRTRTNGALVDIQIEDTGRGVPDKIRQSIFREPVTTKSKEGGMGLLLARSMIDEMGGTVRLLPSLPGRGACFAITLPITHPIDKEG